MTVPGVARHVPGAQPHTSGDLGGEGEGGERPTTHTSAHTARGARAASLHSRREIAASYSTRSPLGTPGHGYFATWRAIPATSIVSIHGLVAASGGRFRDRERAPRTGIPRVVLEARDSHPTPFSRQREKSRLDFSLFAALTDADSAARFVARPTADPS